MPETMKLLVSTKVLAYTTHGKILKYQVQPGTKILNYLMDHLLYQIFKNILNISLKT